MEENTWHDAFIELLYEKYPKNTQLTCELMELLCLEREATYRRLRKEVPFTVAEIAKIATTWNISLDSIIGISSGKVSFQMIPFNYLNPSHKEFSNWQKRVRAIGDLQATPNSEYMEVCNRFPRPLHIGFSSLYRFLIFYWAHQYNSGPQKLFSQMIISDNIKAEFDRYKRLTTQIKNTSFILSETAFENYVESIKYFHSILLITDEERELLKQELYGLLDYITEIATNGCYPETNNKVNIYISQVTIDADYCYLYTDKLKVCTINAFGKFDINSYDPVMVEDFRTWMNLKKRTSVQISEVNERERVIYFARQKEAIDSL